MYVELGAGCEEDEDGVRDGIKRKSLIRAKKCLTLLSISLSAWPPPQFYST
jgi:hypothetical protein